MNSLEDFGIILESLLVALSRLWFAAMIVAVIIMGMAAMSNAATVTKTLTANWDFPAAQESTIAGFRVYNQDAAVVFDNVAPSLRTATKQYTYDDAQVQAFHIVSFSSSGQLSTPSNIKTVAPPFKPLTGTGTFTIELK